MRRFQWRRDSGPVGECVDAVFCAQFRDAEPDGESGRPGVVERFAGRGQHAVVEPCFAVFAESGTEAVDAGAG
ncbi:MAG: hypothetical protein ACJ786_09895 [Catenulispora sp.]